MAIVKKRVIKSKNTPNRYRVVRPKSHLKVSVFCVLLCLFVGCITYKTSRDVAMFFFTMLIPAVTVLAVCVLSKWEIKVDKDKMIYTTTFGRSFEYPLGDPTVVIFNGNRITITCEGKKSINVYNNCINYNKMERHIMSTDVTKQWALSHNLKSK
ncbi:MAG: hypothetical protein GX061_08720 [Eubacteriaceae bacterium]|nr:hypothetical protein [Eubacteriaceae bacterium]